MAKAPSRSPYSPDTIVDNKRIWETPREIVIWPSWALYQKYKAFHDARPESHVWRSLTSFDPHALTQPITQANFDAWRESKIQELVEGPCQPLVRRILDAGHFTLYSNAFGGGDKGVEFTRDLFRYHIDKSGRFFCYLENWYTAPQIVNADKVVTSSYPKPDAEQSKALAKKLNLEPKPSASPSPERPAKRKRTQRPRRDHS